MTQSRSGSNRMNIHEISTRNTRPVCQSSSCYHTTPSTCSPRAHPSTRKPSKPRDMQGFPPRARSAKPSKPRDMQGFEPGFAEANSKPRDIPAPEPHWAFYPAAFQMRQVRARAPVGSPTLHAASRASRATCRVSPLCSLGQAEQAARYAGFPPRVR